MVEAISVASLSADHSKIYHYEPPILHNKEEREDSPYTMVLTSKKQPGVLNPSARVFKCKLMTKVWRNGGVEPR